MNKNKRIYSSCFLSSTCLFKASSFSATRSERCSAIFIRGFQSFFLTIAIKCSVCSGSFDNASLKRLSASSSHSTSSIVFWAGFDALWVAFAEVTGNGFSSYWVNCYSSMWTSLYTPIAAFAFLFVNY